MKVRSAKFALRPRLTHFELNLLAQQGCQSTKGEVPTLRPLSLLSRWKK